MTIELINKGGSGGAPTSTALGTYETIAPGASGTIITIPAVSGQRACITNLFVQGTGQESGITVMLGSNTIISGGNLDDNNAARVVGTFTIGNRNAGADEPPVYADPNQAITVIKDAGNTVNTIAYSSKYVR